MINDLAALQAEVNDLLRARNRVLIAVAGPPGVGKSTYAAELQTHLSARCAAATVVPMDGFHFDNSILKDRGLLARKGSPETFDTAGFGAILKRLRSEDSVAVPIFDRDRDIARASAHQVSTAHRIVIVEGNYLLLRSQPWSTMRASYDCTVFLYAPRAILERRLVQRWIDYGMTHEAAHARALGNDMLNVDVVLRDSSHGSFSFSTS